MQIEDRAWRYEEFVMRYALCVMGLCVMRYALWGYALAVMRYPLSVISYPLSVIRYALLGYALWIAGLTPHNSLSRAQSTTLSRQPVRARMSTHSRVSLAAMSKDRAWQESGVIITAFAGC
ncbi:MAG: hypothetical protein PWP64_146 [Candidatus Cloacimonadota bacterium]|nr:hypothetical protein [Candidatus Cloacimonadota bacterium]